MAAPVLGTADPVSEAVGAGILQVESEWIHKETEEHRWYHETLYPVTLRGYQKLLLVISDRSGEYRTSAYRVRESRVRRIRKT